MKMKTFVSNNSVNDVTRFLVVEEEPLLDTFQASFVSTVAGFSLASGILIQKR
jgi:hypothetical protein